MPALPQFKPSEPWPERDHVSRELAAAIEGEVRFGLHDRMLYATDASLYQVEPLGVIVPASVDDAVRAVEFCVAKGLPILPRGGGTSLAGQCTNRAIVFDFSSRCRAISNVDVGARRAIVEPGITIDDLNDDLSKRGTGLFFAPDPATSKQCNIGGAIGNNSAGARSILYGRTSENLAGVRAALICGDTPRVVQLEAGAATKDPLVRDVTMKVASIVSRHERLIRERFPKTIRRNAGYGLDMVLAQMDRAGSRADTDAILREINLSHLLCGSEGTLAVTLGADLILQPSPKVKGLAVIGFDLLDEAIDSTVPILSTHPSAVELLDDTVINLAAANAEYRRYVDLMPRPGRGDLAAILYVEYFASSTDELRQKFADLRSLMKSSVPNAGMAEYSDAASMAQAWKLRKAGEPLLHGMPGDRKPITFVEDNAVPVENLSRFVREFRQIVQKHGTNAAFWAHASVGVLHVRPFIDIHDEADRQRMQAIAVEVADLARDCGGVMSGEHGDGKVRGPLLERFFGRELMRAFREIKGVFDPRNLLNPGNIVAPGQLPTIVESLRIKPAADFVHVAKTDTYFEFADQHGFEGAVEMCNGAGVCRKKTGGTMCPSYMGTLDERHSTRGRGNALRLAITGQLGGGSVWNDAETMQTLDLCLSCKACKSECPSNVDIARLKAEYTAQRFKSSGRVPLKARVFGRVRALNRIGAIAPGIANAVNRLRPIRATMGALLGLAPQRTIPEFSRSLARSFPRQHPDDDAPTVVLFGDCFTMYNESSIGIHAKRLLEAFGYRVELADAGCCGRALISTGLLDEAISSADRALERLGPVASRPNVRGILALEPSCLSSIKDDWLDLKLQTPKAVRKQVAAKGWLVEEFLERSWNEHPKKPAFRSIDQEVLLHGHCHQKALFGIESSAAILKRVIGSRLRVLDSGCCGMAGSFGYTADHYELSMKIGELVLFPAVRSAGQAVILAPGTSCRHQIKDGTGTSAIHPVQFLSQLLDPITPGS